MRLMNGILLRRAAFSLCAAGCLATGSGIALQAAEPPMVCVFISAKQKKVADGVLDAQKIVNDFWQIMVNRGAVTSAGIVFPTPVQLATQDVLVWYGDKLIPSDSLRRDFLRSFFLRGGGLVIVHNAVQDPGLKEIKEWTGTPWQAKTSAWVQGKIRVERLDPKHPITCGVKPFTADDAAAVGLELDAACRPLAWGRLEDGKEVPVLWTRERMEQRTVVFTLGRRYATWEQPQVQEMLARAIAWAAHKPVDFLLFSEEKARLKAAASPEKAGGSADAKKASAAAVQGGK